MILSGSKYTVQTDCVIQFGSIKHKYELHMLTDKFDYELVPQNQEASSEVNPLLNKEKLEEMLRCPVTKLIFYKPVKLLLVDDLESSGSIVEKDVVSQLTHCPLSRKAIASSIPAREITNLVDLYLTAYPDAKKDQYSPPPATQLPATASHIDVEAQVPLNPMRDNEVEVISFLEYIMLDSLRNERTPTRCDAMVFAIASVLLSVLDSLATLLIGLLILYKHDLDDDKDNRGGLSILPPIIGSSVLSAAILLFAANYSVARNAPIQSLFMRPLRDNPISSSFILSVVFSVGSGVIGDILINHDTITTGLPKTIAVGLVGSSVWHGGAIGLFRGISLMERLNCDRMRSYVDSCTEPMRNYLNQPVSEALRIRP